MYKEPEGAGEVSQTENIQRSKAPSREKNAFEHKKVVVHSKEKIRFEFAKLKSKSKYKSKAID